MARACRYNYALHVLKNGAHFCRSALDTATALSVGSTGYLPSPKSVCQRYESCA